MTSPALERIEQQQIAYMFFTEDYTPQELVIMYKKKMDTIWSAIEAYRSWYE